MVPWLNCYIVGKGSFNPGYWLSFSGHLDVLADETVFVRDCSNFWKDC